MRKIFIVFWLLLPVVVMAYHYGPGQVRMTVDEAATELASGEQFAMEQQWEQAIEKFDRALQLLPEDKIAQMRQVRVAKAKAQMFAHQLPGAHRDLKVLVDEMTTDKLADQEVLKDARSSLANSQYYLTWGPRTAKVGQIFKIFNPMKDSPKREATGAQSNFEALLGLVSRAEKAKCSARSAQAEPVFDAHARRAK